MKSTLRLGTQSRDRLSQILRQTRGTISVREASNILQLPRAEVAKMLSRWARQGWLSRVRRGLYIPVPLEAGSTDIAPEDPWIVADRIYPPCYIGGWTAAQYWGLTEQIFRTVLVMTTRKPANRKPVIKGISFLLRTVSVDKVQFGTKTVWRGQAKVRVSDPTRTIIDMLDDPTVGGGLRPTVEVFDNYVSSEHKNVGLLIAYAEHLGNGAVFKRLGFFAERSARAEEELISACKSRLTAGNAKLDPALAADRLVTRWRLWIPTSWARQKTRD